MSGGGMNQIEIPKWADRMGMLLFDLHEFGIGKSITRSKDVTIKECRKIIKAVAPGGPTGWIAKMDVWLDDMADGVDGCGEDVDVQLVATYCLDSLDGEYQTGWHARAVESYRVYEKERTEYFRKRNRRDFKYDPKETEVEAYLEFTTDHEFRGTHTEWNYRMKKHAVEQFFNNPGEAYGRGRLNDDDYKIVFKLLDDAVYCKGAEDNPTVWIGEHRLEKGEWRCGNNGCYALRNFKKTTKPKPPAPKPKTDEEIRVEIAEDVLRMREARLEEEVLSNDDVDTLIDHANRLNNLLEENLIEVDELRGEVMELTEQLKEIREAVR